MAPTRTGVQTERMSKDIFKPGESSLARGERELKKIENEIFSECSKVVHSIVTDAFDIDPESPEMPAEWLEELERTPEEEHAAKLREFQRRQRIAQYALMSNKNAPVAITIAAKVLSGMQKANAMKDAAPRELNLTMVSISAPGQPVPMFPVKEIKHE